MNQNINKLKKYGIISAVICVFSTIFLGIIASVAVLNGALSTAGSVLLFLSVLSFVVSFVSTIVFSVRFAVCNKQRRSALEFANSLQTQKSNSIPEHPPVFSIGSSPESDAANATLADSLTQYFLRNGLSRVSLSDAGYVGNHDILARYGGIDAKLHSIDLMEGHIFEHWCAGVLNDIGFSDVEVTPGSGDQGVDVVASKDGVKYAIQCKRYTSDLGNSPVQEVYAGKNIYNCHIGVVLTNRYFTRGAKELAEATGVLLWDRDWIKQYLSTKISDNSYIAMGTAQPPESSLATEPDSSYDELIPAAIEVILETGQASISMIQRRLVRDYARAARIMDELESIGVVGTFQGGRPREVYITETEWDAVIRRIKH